MSKNKTSKVVVDATKYPASASGMKVNMAENTVYQERQGLSGELDSGRCIYCATYTKYLDAMDCVSNLEGHLAYNLSRLYEMADNIIGLYSNIETGGLSNA